jgi:hypothetical protein
MFKDLCRSFLTLLVVSATQAYAATPSAGRCLRGEWVSAEYGRQAVVAALGSIPYTSITTDTTAISFRGGLYSFESLLLLETVDGGDVRITRADGSAAASYRVRTNNRGRTFISFHNVTEDRLYVYATAAGVTVGPTIIDNAFRLSLSRIPFTCRRNNLTLRIAGPSGTLVPIRFTRQ